MSLIFRLLVPGLLAATLAACERAPAPPGPTTAPAKESPESRTARTAIEAANQVTAEAITRGDAAAVVAHYAEDALLLPAGSDFVSGRAAIRSRYQRAIDAGLRSLKLEIMSVDAAGDIAVETGRYEAAGASGHRLDHGKYVVTWRREGGQWQAYRDIATSSMPPPVATPEVTALPAPTTTDDSTQPEDLAGS